MINLHERMLPTSTGAEPATSWSPVGRRIQMSHQGRLVSVNSFSLQWVKKKQSRWQIRRIKGEEFALFQSKFFRGCHFQDGAWFAEKQRGSCLPCKKLRNGTSSILTLSMLGKKFSLHFEIFFSYFSQKIGLDILCQFCMKCQSPFSGKKKISPNLLSAELAQWVVKVNWYMQTK